MGFSLLIIKFGPISNRIPENHFEHVRVARVTVVHWARVLHRPPTASPVELGTGVLWVSTGTHPCGPSPRQRGERTRAPALHTLDDVLQLSRR